MRILVAGKDRTPELAPALSAEAAEREKDPRCLFLDWRVNALSLRDCKNERDFAARFLDLTRYKFHVDTRVFDIPRKPGFTGRVMAVFKAFLWKLLRYQHDRVAFRQNLINSNLTSALEFDRDVALKEIARLAARVAELEKRSEGGRAP
jgi:hypothetical protein